MKIKAITKYPFKGKEYNSLKEIKEEVHNIIGEEVLDKINKKIDIRHCIGGENLKSQRVSLYGINQKEIFETLTKLLK